MRLGWLVLCCLIFTLISCTSTPKSKNFELSEADDRVPTDAEIALEGPVTQNDLDTKGSDLGAIPEEVNRSVLQWIDYYQGRGRVHMERYLSRSGRYLPVMKKILRQHGLPEDLVYIALIESGFNPVAHSSANAVGYWQFIRGTGRRYGLVINSYVDERRDFIKSTDAAASYFKSLYNLFGSWYLAIASYNVGENRVKRLVMRYHTRDFWALAKERKLPKETVHYVPKFLAARLIAREPEKYGFGNVEYMPALDFSEVTFNHSVDLKTMAKEMGIDYKELRGLNPAFRHTAAYDNKGVLVLRVPRGMETAALAAAEKSVVQSGKTFYAYADEDFIYHRVKRGETLGGIARKYRTSIQAIRRANRLGQSSQIIAGKKIRVPNGGVVSRARSELADRGGSKKASQARTVASTGGRKVHIVRRGDTLIQIAKTYNVPLNELAQHNQINRRSKIIVGTRLEIPE